MFSEVSVLSLLPGGGQSVSSEVSVLSLPPGVGSQCLQRSVC